MSKTKEYASLIAMRSTMDTLHRRELKNYLRLKREGAGDWQLVKRRFTILELLKRMTQEEVDQILEREEQ